MTTYEDFVVPNSYWEYILQQHRVMFINEYHKKHKNYPSEEDLQKVVLSAGRKEQYKRILYAQYYVTGKVPSDSNTPNLTCCYQKVQTKCLDFSYLRHFWCKHVYRSLKISKAIHNKMLKPEPKDNAVVGIPLVN